MPVGARSQQLDVAIYDPDTGLLYVVTLEQCDIYSSSAKEPKPSSGFRGTGAEQIPAEPGQFYLRALDAATGSQRWEYKMPGPATMWAEPCPQRAAWSLRGTTTGTWLRWIPAQAKTCGTFIRDIRCMPRR